MAARQTLLPRKRRRSRKPAIYVISDGSGCHKVGRTDRPVMQRLAELQTGNPRRLSVVCCIEMDRIKVGVAEDAMHRWLAGRATCGGDEWFTLPDDMVRDVVTAGMEMRDGLPSNPVARKAWQAASFDWVMSVLPKLTRAELDLVKQWCDEADGEQAA